MNEARHGPELLPHGGVKFRLWAPSATSVSLLLDAQEPRPMAAIKDGWYAIECPDASVDAVYKFLIDGKSEVPDPACRALTGEVKGPCKVVASDNFVSDENWSGRPWAETVIYELHVGTFSPEGTFTGVEKRLDHLAETGITAIELMPLAAFAGKRGWGYDGVLPYALHPAYGTAEDLKRLIAAAHNRNIMVFLDVVYNHFGPEGNFLHSYAAPFFTEAHHTPWGAAINFEGTPGQNVRRFYIENAIYWLKDFRFDGLRFDAVHAIHDDTSPHFLYELAQEIRSAFPPERHIHLILENDGNQARYLEQRDNKPVFFTAQWNDDVHHVIHTLLTGENKGYYADYAEDPVRKLGRALTEGFVYQGDSSVYRDNERRGEPSAHLPPTCFINFLQNHDQIGNRALGERIASLTDERRLVLGSAILFLSPQIPMLFMGEEWHTVTPFLYFCDFDGELAEAVRQGRRKEFEKFPAFSTQEAQSHIPDPNEFETFNHSRLNWTEPKHEPFHSRLAFTRRLLLLRQQFIVPLLRHAITHASAEVTQNGVLLCQWTFANAKRLMFAANFMDEDTKHPLSDITTPIWGHTGEYLPAGKCIFALEDADE